MAGASRAVVDLAFPLSDGSGNFRAFDCSAGPTPYELRMNRQILPPASRGAVGRGVYTVPWSGPSGETLLVAIDHRGCAILSASVMPDHDPEPSALAMWDILDREDPPHPPLQLVS